jgi:aryl-phospho-beta-D-glucosidase BglC (GH1 family)
MLSLANLTAVLASLYLEPAGSAPEAATLAKLTPTDDFFQTSTSSCFVTPYSPAPLSTPAFAPFDSKTATIYRYRKQQSVNLGSWSVLREELSVGVCCLMISYAPRFVQENWMAPSLFGCADGNQAAEHDVAAGWLNTSNARQLLEKHWDTWIQESDFAYLASIGINTVRLPIGYWSLGPSYVQDTPFEDVAAVYTNSWPRVLRAIKYAEDQGIGVLVDLHGAPGSQNGK